VQRTEPPAISSVGTDRGSSRAERSMAAFCSTVRLSLSSLRERKNAAIAARRFDRIAGKVGDPAGAQRNVLAARLLQPGAQLGGPSVIGDRVEAHHGKVRGHAHEHAGVMDRLSGPVGVVSNSIGSKLKCVLKRSQRLSQRPRRPLARQSTALVKELPLRRWA
jgi:hypothetical protein